MQTIEGIYRNGRIELREQPRDADNTKVVVTFTNEPVPDDQPPLSDVRAVSATPRVTPLPPGPERDAAVKALLDRMNKGIDFGGAPYPTREEIYNERADELERRRRSNG